MGMFWFVPVRPSVCLSLTHESVVVGCSRKFAPQKVIRYGHTRIENICG